VEYYWYAMVWDNISIMNILYLYILLLLWKFNLDHCCFQIPITCTGPRGNSVMCRGNYQYLIVFKTEFRPTINQTSTVCQTRPHLVVIRICDHLIVISYYDNYFYLITISFSVHCLSWNLDHWTKFRIKQLITGSKYMELIENNT